MKHIVWSKPLLLLAIASSSALVLEVQAAALFHRAAAPDCGPVRLSELLWANDYGQLAACISGAMQSGDAEAEAAVMDWIGVHSTIESPLLLYKSARKSASSAASLARAGHDLSSADEDEVIPALVQLIKFCLYYYIDSVVCLRAAARITKEPMARAALLDAYARELDEKSAEIFSRVAVKWHVLMAAYAACADSYLAVGEAIQHTWQREKLGINASCSGPAGQVLLCERLHSAPWVFGVRRQVHLGTTAHRTAKWLVGSWLSANEPGGLEFNTYDGQCHEYLACVPDAELLKWYAGLRAHALTLLERHATVRDFFSNFNVSALLAAEVTILKAGKRERFGSTSSDYYLLSSMGDEAHDGAVVPADNAASGDALPRIPRLHSCPLPVTAPLAGAVIGRRPISLSNYPPLPESLDDIATIARTVRANSLQSLTESFEGVVSPGAPCFGSPRPVDRDADSELMHSIYAMPLSQALQPATTADTGLEALTGT